MKPLHITSDIHPISEIEPCHSCENRNPGSWLIIWIPASAGMTILDASIVESLNLGFNNQSYFGLITKLGETGKENFKLVGFYFKR